MARKIYHQCQANSSEITGSQSQVITENQKNNNNLKLSLLLLLYLLSLFGVQLRF